MLEKIRGRWNDIRHLLHIAWEDLTPFDVGRMQGSLEDTIDYLKDRYHQTDEEVIEILISIFNDIEDNPELSL